MEEKKHRKPRPEMGTPEYEEWRKRMLQRRRERLKRERRKRLIAIGVAAVLIAGGVSAGAIALSNRFAPGSDRKVVTSDTKKENHCPDSNSYYGMSKSVIPTTSA